LVSRLLGNCLEKELLQDVAQIGPLGAHAEVVQHHVALRELELGALALGLERRLDGVEVLVTGTLPTHTR